MTPIEIQIEVAKLDGWEMFRPNVMIHKWGGNKIQAEASVDSETIQRYTTSRDAIVPVIIKICDTFSSKSCFLLYLKKELGISISEDSYYSIYALFQLVMEATPLQLCIALLKACGKWRD